MEASLVFSSLRWMRCQKDSMRWFKLRPGAVPEWCRRSHRSWWKIRVLRDQARGWDDLGLARAITAVAQADADVKGAASDAAYALERMVLRVATARIAR